MTPPVYGHSRILARLAEEERVGRVPEFVGTPTVARDMLSIAEAFRFEMVNYWGIS